MELHDKFKNVILEFPIDKKDLYNDKKAQNIELVSETPTQENEVQAVSGATISSESIVEAVNIAVNLFNKMEE